MALAVTGEVVGERYQLVPPLSPEDYQRLRDSISERGVVIPVTVDQDGNLLDGHHRRKAAAELGVPCPETVVHCDSEEQRLALAASLNADRRQMTDAQRVYLGRTLEGRLADVARQRMAEGGAKAAPGKPGTLVPPFTEPQRTRDDVARQVGLGSGRSYERGKQLAEKAESFAPDVAEKMANGAMTIREASREVRQREKAVRVAEIASRVVDDNLNDLATFPVLYVDPPWRYEHAPDSTRQIENHYPTLSLDEICALPVPADDDAVLFLWATSPKLAEAMRVLDAWDFSYRTCMVWVKDRVGMGYYARQRHELLLIAVRGKPETPIESARPDSVIEAPRGAHSAKPERVYEVIEAMYPHLPKVELFARNQRDGWAAWGNQAAAA